MNISTSLSGFFSGLGDIASGAVGAIAGAAPAFAPLIAAAVAPRPRTASYSGGGGMPYGQSSFLPYSSGGIFGGGGLVQQTGGPLGDVFGNQPQIQQPVFRKARFPHLLQTIDGSRVITYVRAPQVKYRISISRSGGRCHRRPR